MDAATQGLEAGRESAALEAGAADVSNDVVVSQDGPLSHCIPGALAHCSSGSTCVEGCPSPTAAGPNSGISARGGVCSVPTRESCGCGVVLQPCTTPGLTCLMPSCCDYEGLCLTPDERATICAGPDAVRFHCGP